MRRGHTARAAWTRGANTYQLVVDEPGDGASWTRNIAPAVQLDTIGQRVASLEAAELQFGLGQHFGVEGLWKAKGQRGQSGGQINKAES